LLYFGAQDYSGAITLNGGKFWIPVVDGSSQFIHIYGCFASDQNTLIGNVRKSWSGSYEPYVFVSHNGGLNFTNTTLLINQNISHHSLQVLQSLNDPKILFSGQYRTTDNGYTWEEMDGCDCVSVINPVSPHELYGYKVNSTIIVVSYDDGVTWNEVNPDQPFFQPKDKIINSQILDMAYDHINHILYIPIRTKWGANYEKFRFFRFNVTSGESEDILNKMNGGRRFYSAAVDPNCVNIVYAGGGGDYYLNQQSVQRSFDFGETWQVLTTNPTNSILNDTIESYGYEAEVVRVNPINGEVLIGTNCFGFYTLSPPYDPSLIREKITKHIVIFRTNGGIKVDNQTVDNRNCVEYCESDRVGYTFDGWYIDKECTDKYNFSTLVTDSLTLYAKWKPCPIINLMINGNLFNTTNNVDNPIVPIFIESPKAGYVFDKWYVNQELTIPYVRDEYKNSVTIYAGFFGIEEENLYTRPDTVDLAYFIHFNDSKIYNTSLTRDRSIRIKTELSAKYAILMNMESRFRIGFVWKAEPVYGTLTKNYTIHELDTDIGTQESKDVHLIAEAPEKDGNYMFVYYWTKKMNRTPEDVKETIRVYKLVSDTPKYIL
jgi:uncharacterized repeat protein (TIGR02543 family)